MTPEPRAARPGRSPADRPGARAASRPPPHLTERERTLVLAGILLAMFLGALDQTIVSTALPRIVEDLEGVSRYAWVATAYLLASTVLVPLYGKLADTYPRKHVELAAVGLFLGGSMLCGLAGEFGSLPLLGDGMNQLVWFRAVQGAGAAGLFSMTFIVIADLFPPSERGRYQGLVGAVWGVASVLGPLLGGLLTDHAGGLIPGVEGWRWVFYVNVPVGAAAVAFLVRSMPRLEPPGSHGPPDLASVALLLAGLTPPVLAFQLDKRRFPWVPDGGAGAEGWVVVASLAVGAVALAAFASRSRRVESPVVDLRLFRDAVFRRANAAAFVFGAAFMSVVIFLPLFLVNVLEVSATRAGLALVPFSMGLVFGSSFAGQVVSRIGHLRGQILAGGALLLVALVLMARMDAGVGYTRVLGFMVLCGLGFGPTLPLFTLAIQNAVDVRLVGQATSAAQFFRQIGGTVGAAVMGSVMAATLVGGLLQADLPQALRETPSVSAERLAATGGADLPQRVRALYEARGGAPGAAPAADVEAEVRRVDGIVKAAFTRATTRVYALAAVLVAAAWFLTLRMPERPLRTTHDREELA